MLRHPCIPGDPQRQARGATSGTVLNKRGGNLKWLPHTGLLGGGQKRAVMLRHPSILWDPQRQARKAKSEMVRNKGGKNLKWQPHTCRLAGLKEGGNAMSPLHSRGSPTPSTGSKIRNGPQHRGTKSEEATSHLPSRGPKRGRKGDVTPGFSGIPKKRRTKSEVATSPLPSGEAKGSRNATSPLYSRRSPKPSAGSKIGNGPQQRRKKPEEATSSLPSG